ncbi:MAG: hypothetical protein ACR2JM_16595 [Mycobacterium sp.]
MRRGAVAFSRIVMVLVAVWMSALFAPGISRAEPKPEPGPEPAKVVVGAFIHDIQEVDLEAGSFVMDFYIWMRWKDPAIDPTDSIEPMNSNGMENTTTSSTGGVTGKALHPAPRVMPDGSLYNEFRYQGVFSRKMNLEKFPFDEQTLLVFLEDQDQDTRYLEFVPDTTPIAISKSVTIPGYRIGMPTLTVAPHLYPTNFGDISAPKELKYSRIIIRVPVDRDVLPYMVKIMLPIMIVILITSLIYIMPARFEESRAAVGVTAMLTIVALQWSTDADLPSVEYLTMLDLIYILSMLYILVAMGYTVVASRRSKADAAEAIMSSLDRKMGIASLAIYVVLIAVTVIMYLQHQHADLLIE